MSVSFLLYYFSPHIIVWDEKIINCFFLQIQPNLYLLLHLVCGYFGHRGPVGSPSAWQTGSSGFEAGA